MKRLPRGGAKVNYTLYLTKEERDMIKERATELEMSDSYYIMKLYEMDSQIGLLEHLEAGGTIALQADNPGSSGEVPDVPADKEEVQPDEPIEPGQMPVAEDVAVVQVEFQKKLGQAQQAEQQTEVPETVEPKRRFQRPKMRSLAETVAAQSGVNIHTGASGDTRNPGMSAAEIRAGQQLDPDWQRKIHQELQRGESSDAKLRKEIIENLPPVEKAEATADGGESITGVDGDEQ